MANTNCFHAAPPGRKNSNELLQCLFVDGRRAVPDERLLCYPTRKVSQVDGYLFRSVTVSQTNVLSFARINVVSARILGGVNCTPPPVTPRPVRLCTPLQYYCKHPMMIKSNVHAARILVLHHALAVVLTVTPYCTP